MAEKLDQKRIRQLLGDADRKWFNHINGPRQGWNYQEWLDFTSDYLVRNYRATTGPQRAVSGTPGKGKSRSNGKLLL